MVSVDRPAAAAAIGAFLGSQAEYKISTDEVIKQAQKRQETLTEEAKAYKELKQAQIEQASADLAQVAQTQVLYDELRNLVAANGEVNESNRARVNFILGELNNAYGTEYKLIDGVIQGYQNMQTEIDNLIEKKKWEIVQKAALPAYEEAVNNQIANRIQLEKDLAAVEEQKGKVLQAENELKAAQVELDEKRETA